MIDKTTSENFISSDFSNDEMDFLKIFRLLLMQSKLIISIVMVVFVISYALYSFGTKKYKIVSLIQYEAFNQKVFDPSETLQYAYPGSSSSDITNMIQLYESRTNYLKVIKDLKLNLNIKNLEDDENIDISITSKNNKLHETHKLKFSFTDSGYSLLDKELNEIERSKYDEQILFKGLKILVTSSNLKKKRPIDVLYRNPESMYNHFKSRIDVQTSTSKNSFFTSEGLITVSYTSEDIDLGKKIINYSNNIFLNQRIANENEKSRKAINFIDENIISIKDSVEANKVKLKKFREQNKSINVNLEIEAIIKKIQLLDESLSSIDIEIAKAKEIYTYNNPAYLNLLSKKTLIEDQKNKVLSEIEMMPKEQQEYIDLYNNLQVSQTLFEELESRRLGFSLLEASTIGDVRVVDEAYVFSQVSPKIFTVIFSTFIGFVIASIVAILRGLYFLPISNPAEIFDNNIYVPAIGVIPIIDAESNTDNDNRVNASIETLIVNINSMKNADPHKNLITITSPSPNNGKSTISSKLAKGLTLIGKKVLLVDNDLKRGKLAEKYDVKSISENTFNQIDESTINKYFLDNGLYFIPRVKGLTNSIQFLYSHKYAEKIKFFKEHFDYVIFDTGPVLSVADASVLIDKSDINLLIVRHGINKINEIKQVMDNLKQIDKKLDGIIYNAFARPKNYYGYYGLYGNYSYQYYADKYLNDNYEYEKED